MTYRQELEHSPDIVALAAETRPVPTLLEAEQLFFCGCGTSFYLAGAMAMLCRAQGRTATAVEAVTLLEHPPMGKPAGVVYLFISRSGSSMETVEAAKIVQKAGFLTFYLGCTKGSPLEKGCREHLLLLFAREHLTLESYSFMAQGLALALGCGLSVQTANLPALLEEAIQLGRRTAVALPPKLWRRLIVLGAPFYRPFCRELMLKNGELTLIPGEEWGLLEFRHGPRCWADKSCLIFALPGQITAEYDRQVAAELVEFGATVLWFSEKSMPGSIQIALPASRYTMEELLLLFGFSLSMAATIGEDLGVDAAHPKNITYAVEIL